MSIEDVAIRFNEVSSTRVAAIIGIIALVGGPVALIAFGGQQTSNLPWYVWSIILLALVLVIWRGYVLFTRTHDAKDISISPVRR
jgi:drug/metabolite transporter (DMT)-like permease